MRSGMEGAPAVAPGFVLLLPFSAAKATARLSPVLT